MQQTAVEKTFNGGLFFMSTEFFHPIFAGRKKMRTFTCLNKEFNF